MLSIPADYTAECSDDHPMDDATATDNCATVDIALEVVTTPGAYAGDYSITRTWISLLMIAVTLLALLRLSL